MAIVINGSTNSISGLAVGGLPNGVVDTDMLANNAVSGSKLVMPVGTIIQIQFANYNTQKTSGSNSLSNSNFQPTGLSVSITPTNASNKIFILYDQSWFYQTASPADGTAQGLGFRLYRDTTEITSRSQYNDWYQDIGASANQRVHGRASSQFLDSPNTTNAITYSLKIRMHTADYSDVRCQYTDGANTESNSYMTAMEVVA